jgi:hypothetical protein
MLSVNIEITTDITTDKLPVMEKELNKRYQQNFQSMYKRKTSCRLNDNLFY